MKALYYSLIYSHLTYGSLLWGNSTSTKEFKAINLLHKKAIRLVVNSEYNSPTDPICREHRLLNTSNIVEAETSKFMYSFFHNLLPKPLNSIFTKGVDVHNYETRYRENPQSVKRKYAQLDHSFMAKGPNVWQNIPNDIKNLRISKVSPKR